MKILEGTPAHRKPSQYAIRSPEQFVRRVFGDTHNFIVAVVRVGSRVSGRGVRGCRCLENAPASSVGRRKEEASPDVLEIALAHRRLIG
jgi:hypothetical protein